jgi:hypothetical protein
MARRTPKVGCDTKSSFNRLDRYDTALINPELKEFFFDRTLFLKEDQLPVTA